MSHPSLHANPLLHLLSTFCWLVTLELRGHWWLCTFLPPYTSLTLKAIRWTNFCTKYGWVARGSNFEPHSSDICKAFHLMSLLIQMLHDMSHPSLHANPLLHLLSTFCWLVTLELRGHWWLCTFLPHRAHQPPRMVSCPKTKDR